MIKADRYWKDDTGRFQRRPYFDDETLELGATEFVSSRLGIDAWPISDENLELLVEFEAILDRGQDINLDAVVVDGITIFSGVGLPRIVINRDLGAANMRMRRRMTTAHELGHVVLHHPLYLQTQNQLNMLEQYRATPAYCEHALERPTFDWCEYQASYFGGALLAPRHLIRELLEGRLILGVAPEDDTHEAKRMGALVAEHFMISKIAARIRLLQSRLVAPARVHNEVRFRTG